MSAPVRSSLRVAIVGGGVCGLGIGWRLAAAGCTVDLFERDQAGRGASWAAAGMLAAQAEAEPGEDRLIALCRESQQRWPDFAASLEATGGGSVGYRSEGTLLVALTRDDVVRLDHEGARLANWGLRAERLTALQARRKEPLMAPAVQAALYFAGDHQVDNRLVVERLVAAFAAAGGRLHEREPVQRIEVTDGVARAVHTAAGRHEADFVVLAAGAWSNLVDGLGIPERPPVRPVKGQMLAVAMDPAAPLLRHVLWAPGVYLVPRQSGRLLVGATVEERGFDRTITAGGLLGLLHAAWRVLPGLQELPVEEIWCGFRPGSPDDAPMLGPSAGAGNLILATGHHRNGILLLPVTAEAIATLILTGALPDWAAAFHPNRFGPTVSEPRDG